MPQGVEQSNFLDKVPATGRQPKKIRARWSSDTEGIMDITADPHKLRRALASDASHESSEQRKARRAAWGLPEKAPPWKELAAAFSALTKEDIEDLKSLGYRPDLVRNTHSETVERMLHDLKVLRSENT